MEIFHLQFIDKVFDASVVQVQQVPRVQSVRRQSSSYSCSSLLCGHCRCHARRCATRVAGWFRRQENYDGPAVAVHLNRCSMSLLAQFIDKILTVWRLWRWDGVFWLCFPHFSRSSRSSGFKAPVFGALGGEEFFAIEGSLAN